MRTRTPLATNTESARKPDALVESMATQEAQIRPELVLDEESHVYTLGGRVLPSVTEILCGAGLVDTQWFTDAGKWRGSAVHAACWYEDENDLDEAGLDPRLAGYLAAYRKFKAETEFVVEVNEMKVHHDLLGYAGRFDKVGKFAKGPALIDLKSGAASKVTRYQTTAYVACLASPRKYTRMEVRLKDNGKYSLQVYEPRDFDRDFAIWQSVLSVYSLKKELGL